MSFILYILGFAIFILGLAIAANRLGVSHFWIAVGVVILFGLGILTGVSQTRHRDPSQ
jgi:hypothetical protein